MVENVKERQNKPELKKVSWREKRERKRVLRGMDGGEWNWTGGHVDVEE